MPSDGREGSRRLLLQHHWLVVHRAARQRSSRPGRGPEGGTGVVIPRDNVGLEQYAQLGSFMGSLVGTWVAIGAPSDAASASSGAAVYTIIKALMLFQHF